jgi:hypothetical protein
METLVQIDQVAGPLNVLLIHCPPAGAFGGTRPCPDCGAMFGDSSSFEGIADEGHSTVYNAGGVAVEVVVGTAATMGTAGSASITISGSPPVPDALASLLSVMFLLINLYACEERCRLVADQEMHNPFTLYSFPQSVESTQDITKVVLLLVGIL